MLSDQSRNEVADTSDLLNTDLYIKASLNTPCCRMYATMYSKSHGTGRFVSL